MKIIVVGTNSPGGISTVISSYESYGIYENFEYKRIISHTESSKITNLFIFLKSLIKLFSCAYKKSCIVHVHASMRGSFFRKSIIIRLSKYLNCKVIYHLHGSEFKLFMENLNSPIKRYAISTFEKCDYFITLSDSWKTYVNSLGRINTVVINNCVDDYASSLHIDNPNLGNTLCFLGALGERKGIYDLLEACKIIKDRGQIFKLLIGGNGEIVKTQELIKQLQLSNECKLLGWVDSETKFKILQQSSVLILPSYNEGLPMVVLESLATKTAVITTPVGGIPEVISDNVNGKLIKPGDIEALTNAMQNLLQDKELTEKLAISGYETFKQTFDKSVVSPRISKIYHQLTQDIQ